MTPFLAVVLLALACHRVTRAITVDVVALPVRELIRNRWPEDPTRAITRWSRSGWRALPESRRRKPRMHGPGYFIQCGWCVGWWVAGALVLAVCPLLPGFDTPAEVLLTWPAVAAAADLVRLVEDRLGPTRPGQ